MPRSPPSSPMRLRSSESSSSKPNHPENHSENESELIVRREPSLGLNHRHCHRRNKRHRCHRHHRFKTNPVDGNLLEATNSNILKANDSKTSTYTCDDPLNWNCDDVHRFVSSVTDTHIADQFRIQEIDGLALGLLQSNPNDHLMMINIMKIKLGPMLRIINKFQDLKNKFQT